MPISCTSPPQRRTAIACASSCSSLITGKHSHIIATYPGVSMCSRAWAHSASDSAPAASTATADADQPEPEHHGTEKQLAQRIEPHKPGRGVEQRQAEGERIDARPALPATALAVPLENPVGVRRMLRLQQLVLVQLPQQPDHLVLRGRGIPAALEHGVPDLLHRARAVAAADELVGRFIDAVLAARGVVGQDIPLLIAPALAPHAHLRAQARLQARYAVPLFAEQRCRQFSLPRTTGPGAASR